MRSARYTAVEFFVYRRRVIHSRRGRRRAGVINLNGELYGFGIIYRQTGRNTDIIIVVVVIIGRASTATTTTRRHHRRQQQHSRP